MPMPLSVRYGSKKETWYCLRNRLFWNVAYTRLPVPRKLLLEIEVERMIPDT